MHTGVRGIPTGRGKDPDGGRAPLTENAEGKAWNPGAYGEGARGDTGKVDGGVGSGLGKGWMWSRGSQKRTGRLGYGFPRSLG